MILTSLYVFLFWLCGQVFGNNFKTILISSIMSWSFFILLFWLGLANMNLSSWLFAMLVLPLAFLETFVACFIASKLYLKKITI